ncbi:MAG: hypothetical protein ACI9EF_003045 [Pseudohongiellaceae bacterium]|jgi:hypothetical protein
MSNATPNLALRQKTTADVLTGCTEVKELEDGYALKYPKTSTWSGKLDAFTEAWRKSSPNMTFELVERDDSSSVWLEIRGPEGTKPFVEGARYMLMSHLNPAMTTGYRLRHGMRYLTSPLRVLPDFLIIGAKKCGTTALYNYLTQHPAIAPALKKEIYFFNAYFGKGKLWYKAFFPTVFEKFAAKTLGGRQFLTGEATPDYLYLDDCPAKVAQTTPNARLIAILRNPIDRAYSFYNHNLRAGLETLSFEEAIDQEEQRLADERVRFAADPSLIRFHTMHHSYKLRGVYVDQLKTWTDVFPRDQLLVLKTEDQFLEPEQTLRRAFEHLGLEYHAPEAFKKINTAPYSDMDPAVREKLSAYFEPHNQRLYDYLGTDLAW